MLVMNGLYLIYLLHNETFTMIESGSSNFNLLVDKHG